MRHNERIECKCGGTYTMYHRKGHENTKRHQCYLKGEEPLSPYECIHCECGGRYQRRKMKRHLRSKKHQQYLVDGINRSQLSLYERQKPYLEAYRRRLKAAGLSCNHYLYRKGNEDKLERHRAYSRAYNHQRKQLVGS